MHEELLYFAGDIEPSSLKAQNNVLNTDVVCADKLAVAVNDLCTSWWAGALNVSPLKVDRMYYKTGFTGGTMLLGSRNMSPNVLYTPVLWYSI